MPGFGNFGTGSALTSPQVPAAGVQPTDPSQVGLWQKFQKRLQDDPNLRMALLTTGLNLLRSPEPGRNNFDVFADATTTGVGTLDQLRQRDLSNERLDRREGLDERRTVATESNAAAVTERTGIARDSAAATATARADALEETKRQFNARIAAGDFGPAGGGPGSTGAERIMSSLVDAYVGTGVFPETPEGRQEALIFVNELERSKANPQSGANKILEIAQKIVERAPFNDSIPNNITFQEAAKIAQGVYSDSLAAIAEATTPQPEVLQDPAGLAGVPVQHDKWGTGDVEYLGPDQYRVTFPDAVPPGTKLTDAAGVRRLHTGQGK